MKLLLTGSDGFVGSLLKHNRPCVALADDSGNIDLRDAERVRRAVARIAPDAVSSAGRRKSMRSSEIRPRRERNSAGRPKPTPKR